MNVRPNGNAWESNVKPHPNLFSPFLFSLSQSSVLLERNTPFVHSGSIVIYIKCYINYAF